MSVHLRDKMLEKKIKGFRDVLREKTGENISIPKTLDLMFSDPLFCIVQKGEFKRVPRKKKEFRVRL